jgi:hypothetical protein
MARLGVRQVTQTRHIGADTCESSKLVRIWERLALVS